MNGLSSSWTVTNSSCGRPRSTCRYKCNWFTGCRSGSSTKTRTVVDHVHAGDVERIVPDDARMAGRELGRAVAGL